MASTVATLPMVALGEVLVVVDRSEVPIAGKPYRTVGVKWWGEGVYEREPIDGSQTQYSVLRRIEAGDIIINKIWARHGSVAVVQHALSGCYASTEFPTWTAAPGRLDPGWMHWLSKTKAFWEQCDEKSRGTSGKNRIRPERFLEIEIPLPPLDEQRRIVARIEALAHRIEQARGLRREAIAEAEALWKSSVNTVWSEERHWNQGKVRDLAQPVSGQVNPQIEPFASLPHLNGESMESGTCRLLTNYRSAKDDGVTSGKFHFHAGAVLYSKIRPYLMKAVQVPLEGVCSADVYAFEQFNPAVEPRFFMYSLVSPRFTQYAIEVSGRTRMPKLNQDQLFSFSMSYPNAAEQRRIVAYLDDIQARVDALKRLQAETAAELDALLPSVLARAFRGEL